MSFFGSRVPGQKIYFGEEKNNRVQNKIIRKEDEGLSYEQARKLANDELAIVN